MVIAIILIVLILAFPAGLFLIYYKVFYSPHRDADEVNAPLVIKNDQYRNEIHRRHYKRIINQHSSKSSANFKASRHARALFKHSSNSFSATESATIPAPERTKIFPFFL